MGVLFAVKFIYSIEIKFRNVKLVLCILILFPDILWYDIMSSRETLMAIIVMISSVCIAKYVQKIKFSYFLLISTIITIAAVRTSFLVIIFINYILLELFNQNKSAFKIIIKTILLVFFASIAPLFQEIIGGGRLDYYNLFKSIFSFSDNAASIMDWSNSSVGALLLPNNIVEAILVTPLRMIAYLVAPMPNFIIDLGGLCGGDWHVWQHLMALMSSVVLTVIFPLTVAFTNFAYAHRQACPKLIIFPLIYWTSFIAVGGGNLIIQERYRIVFIVPMIICAWLGYSLCSKSRQIYLYAIWALIMAISSFFYIAYKYLS
jgi:hypothetical protein